MTRQIIRTHIAGIVETKLWEALRQASHNLALSIDELTSMRNLETDTVMSYLSVLEDIVKAIKISQSQQEYKV